MNLIVISNATPIVSLCTVGCENILQQLFHQIIIPLAVQQELCALHKPGAQFTKYDWVSVATVTNQEFVFSLRKDLDAGEAETIALARQMNADVVLIDEMAGYQLAKHFDLPVVRTLSLLKTAKQKQIISEVRPLVEDLIRKGRWYARDVIERFLRDLGE